MAMIGMKQAVAAMNKMKLTIRRPKYLQVKKISFILYIDSFFI